MSKKEFLHVNNILAFDHDWQFPAITEQHAYEQIRRFGGMPEGQTYVAFPWATLLDKTKKKAPDLDTFRKYYQQIKAKIPLGNTTVTTCQHISFMTYRHFFAQCGIDHVFWSHTPSDQTVVAALKLSLIHI